MLPETPWHLHTVDEAPSTQDLAIAAAQAGAPHRTAWLALRQTAGRGRDGRVWQAPLGNLNLSVLLRPVAAQPAAARWSLMAGLSLHDAAAPLLADASRLALKWPNDLTLNGAKVAGILIDSALAASGTLDWLVIGMGANLREAPALPDRPATSLAAHGASVTARDFAALVLHAMDTRAAQPLATIRDAWLARAHPPGTPLRVRQGAATLDGIFETLSPQGLLILRGHPPIASGEIVPSHPDASRH